MNLALSALLILVILLPAFTFRIGISLPASREAPQPTLQQLHIQVTRNNLSKALFRLNFTETVFLFSFVPLLLHLVSICILEQWCTIRFDLLLDIFAGKENVLAGTGNIVFRSYLKGFLLYALVEAAAGWLLGFLLSKALMDKRWLMHALMNNNPWYKLFTAQRLPPAQKKELAAVLVEALIYTKETSVIYSGFLKDYEMAAQPDVLAYLTLAGAQRRDLRAGTTTHKDPADTSSTTTTRYQDAYGPLIPIPGTSFTLKGTEIINLNVTYLKMGNDAAGNDQLIPM